MYLLEGNIGAGKSTLLKLIARQMPEVMIAQEPVDWQLPIEGRSLLSQFYTHPARWAYTMETFTMLSRISQLPENAQYCISERSVYSGYYCFAHNSYESGFMSTLEWKMCTNWFTFLVPRLCAVPDGFIYLRVSPERAFERVQKRNRTCEATVSLDYLSQIHACHDRFLIDRKNLLSELNNVPVLILSTDSEFETDSVERDRLLSHIKAFITSKNAPRTVFHESLTV